MNRLSPPRRKLPTVLLTASVALTGLLMPRSSARGADNTWTGLFNNDWGYETGFPLFQTNWLPQNTLPGSTSDVLFDDTGARNTVLLGSNRTVRSIEFAGSSNYDLSQGGYTLTLTSGDLTASGAASHAVSSVTVKASPEWHIGEGVLVNVSGVLNESGATPYVLTKSGAGTLRLSNNQLAGTIVTGGTLRVSTNSGLGEANADIQMSDGTKITVESNSFIADAGRRLILDNGEIGFSIFGFTANWLGRVQGAGALTKQGSGSLILGGTTNNTNSGLTTVAQGTLQLSKTAGANAIGGDLLVDGGTLIFAADDQLSDSAVVTLQSGTISFGATSQIFDTLVIEASASLQLSPGAQLNLDVLDVNNGNIFANLSFGVGDSTLSVNRVLGDLLQSSGTLDPGDSIGTTHITGIYENRGRISIELAGDSPGTEHDEVVVDGAIALFSGAVLDVTLIDEFVPSAGEVFDVLDFASLSGTFGVVNLPSLPGGMTWDQSQLYTEGRLRVLPSLSGDYNNDGVVDAADYTVWRDGLGATFPLADYDVWRSNFGNVAAGLSTDPSAVPEPNSVLLLTLGATLIALARRDRVREQSSHLPSCSA